MSLDPCAPTDPPRPAQDAHSPSRCRAVAPNRPGGGALAVAGLLIWRNGPEILPPALLFGAGPTLAILGKHLDKLDADTARGMRTLPVRLGEARTRHAVAALTLLQYPLLIALVLTGRLPGPAVLMLGAIPTAIPLLRMSRRPWPADQPGALPRVFHASGSFDERFRAYTESVSVRDHARTESMRDAICHESSACAP